MMRSDDAVAVGEIGAVCAVIWRGAVTEAPFELQRVGLEQVVERHPEGAAFLCIVEGTAKPPNDKLRSASGQMINAHGDRLKCVACVMEGQGFLNAVNRGALAGMVLLLRNKKTSVSVFATVKEATEWMRKHLALTADFGASVEHLRSTLPSQSRR
jgi:hypothetical protein